MSTSHKFSSHDLKYQEMVPLLAELCSQVVGKKLVALYESPLYYFHFLFEDSPSLLVCLKRDLLRFHLSYYSFERQKGPFSEQLSSYLKPGATLKEVQLLNKDRILALTFLVGKEKYQVIIEFFPKSPNLYLLDGQKNILLLYNSKKSKRLTDEAPTTTYVVPLLRQVPQETPPPPITSEVIEKLYGKYEREALIQENKELLIHKLQQEIKVALKKHEKATRQIKEAAEWERVQHNALLLQGSLYQLKKGMNQVTLNDWSLENKEVVIALDPLVEPKVTIEKLFTRSKRLRAGERHWRELQEQAMRELSQLKEKLTKLEAVDSLEGLKPFQKEDQAVDKLGRVERRLKPYHLFHSPSGVEIWVGKSDKDNEKMVFQHANGSDWWLHVRDYPGSHVVIRTMKGAEPDETTLKEALRLAVKYSKAKGKSGVEVCLTQCKYLKKCGRGSPGKVSMSKHRVVIPCL